MGSRCNLPLETLSEEGAGGNGNRGGNDRGCGPGGNGNGAGNRRGSGPGGNGNGGGNDRGSGPGGSGWGDGGDALRLPAPGPSEPGRGERESAGAGWHIDEAGGVTLHTPALFDRLTAGVCLRVSTRPPRLD